MTLTAIAWILGLLCFIGAALWGFRRGRKEAERDYMEQVHDDLEEAQGIRRDVSSLSRDDLVNELRRRSNT